MTIRNHINPAFGPRQFVRITTVRTDTRKIEAQLKDGGNIQISLFDVPSFFVWPKEGEYWIVRQDGGYWKLDNKFDNADDTKVIHLAPGEAKVAAEVIKTPSGKSIVIIDDSKVTSGQVIGYQNGVWRPIDQTGGATGSTGPAGPVGPAGTFTYRSLTQNNFTLTGSDYFVEVNTNTLPLANVTATGTTGSITYTYNTGSIPHNFVPGNKVAINGFTNTRFNSPTASPYLFTINSVTTSTPYSFSITSNTSGSAGSGAGNDKTTVQLIVNTLNFPNFDAVPIGTIYEIRNNQLLTKISSKTYKPDLRVLINTKPGTPLTTTTNGKNPVFQIGVNNTVRFINTGSVWRAVGSYATPATATGTIS